MSNKTLRVVFWNETYLPRIGGVEIFTERLGTGLIQRGHEVFVVTDVPRAGFPRSESVNGISVRRFPFREIFGSENDPNNHSDVPRRLAWITKEIMELKDKIRPDIVHVNFCGPSAYFHLKTARRFPAQTVITFQTALTTTAGEDGLVRALLKEATVVVAPSRAAARNIELSTGYSLDQISVIAPGVPHSMFAPATDSRSGLPTIVFIGRLVEDKGADIAVRAMHALRGIANLNIVGDGPQRPALENLVRELSLEDSVHFSGQVDDDRRRRLLAEAFVMVVPSRHEELFGMVAVEAALSSLPVVATSRGGLPEVVKDRKTGIIIPPDDPTALSAALRSLLNDRGLAAAMGRAGRSRALREFSLEKAINRYETLYFKACPDLD